MYENLKTYVRDIISVLCRYKDVEIIDGAVCEDYIHLNVTIPPKYFKVYGVLERKERVNDI